MAKLSVRKQRWVDTFKPKVIRGKPLNPSITSEQRYYDELRAVILRMTSQTDKELEAFFKTDHAEDYFADAEDISVASQARILMNKITEKVQAIFGELAKSLAEGMVTTANADSARSLKSSLKQLSGGLTLKTDLLTKDLGDVLTASVAENVGLIKSISSKYLTNVQGAVMRSITTGNGLADLVPFLRSQEGVTLRRARLIARDQTRKAYSSINKVRMEKIGIKEFEWLHSGGGQTPRTLHMSSHTEGGLNGGIYSFAALPVIDRKTGERGIPGQLINCRCRMVPVVKFDEGSND